MSAGSASTDLELGALALAVSDDGDDNGAGEGAGSLPMASLVFDPGWIWGNVKTVAFGDAEGRRSLTGGMAGGSGFGSGAAGAVPGIGFCSLSASAPVGPSFRASEGGSGTGTAL